MGLIYANNKLLKKSCSMQNNQCSNQTQTEGNGLPFLKFLCVEIRNCRPGKALAVLAMAFIVPVIVLPVIILVVPVIISAIIWAVIRLVVLLLVDDGSSGCQSSGNGFGLSVSLGGGKISGISNHSNDSVSNNGRGESTRNGGGGSLPVVGIGNSTRKSRGGSGITNHISGGPGGGIGLVSRRVRAGSRGGGGGGDDLRFVVVLSNNAACEKQGSNNI